MLSNPFGYTMNQDLVGINLEKLGNPAEVVFAFDGVGGANRTDGVGGIRWRHDNDTAMFLFADGHAHRVSEAEGPPNFSVAGSNVR
jgi:prepilin-type processing-associated H-X9-DG protein